MAYNKRITHQLLGKDWIKKMSISCNWNMVWFKLICASLYRCNHDWRCCLRDGSKCETMLTWELKCVDLKYSTKSSQYFSREPHIISAGALKSVIYCVNWNSITLSRGLCQHLCRMWESIPIEPPNDRHQTQSFSLFVYSIKLFCPLTWMPTAYKKQSNRV